MDNLEPLSSAHEISRIGVTSISYSLPLQFNWRASTLNFDPTSSVSRGPTQKSPTSPYTTRCVI